MQKAQYEKHCPIPQDVIHAVEFEKPAIGSDQAWVEVLAAPINPSDILTLTGDYGMLPPLPAVGGNEGVGRVVEVGTNVKDLAAGQIVLLPVGIGTWTTHLVADAKKLIPLPNDADPKQLAMMTVNPPTASLLLSEFVDLQAGDWVIQNAANSGVGGYLVQMAKIRGFKTVNIVRRESAIDVVKQNGGDVVLVDEGDDLYKKVANATGNSKITLGIDAVGGKATDRLADCLAESATLVNYGIMSGKPCMISPRSFIFNNVTLRGFWLAKWFQKTSAQRQMTILGEVIQMIASGKINSKIHATYNVSQIKEAVAVSVQGKRDGKVLIVPND